MKLLRGQSMSDTDKIVKSLERRLSNDKRSNIILDMETLGVIPYYVLRYSKDFPIELKIYFRSTWGRIHIAAYVYDFNGSLTEKTLKVDIEIREDETKSQCATKRATEAIIEILYNFSANNAEKFIRGI